MQVKYQDTINAIMHGHLAEFNFLRSLQTAVDCKKRIPKHSKDVEIIKEALGIKEVTKANVKQVRQELIEGITHVIVNQKETAYHDEMLPDNYARLFHALAILKLEKNTTLLPRQTDNYMYNATYLLWKLDDGSPESQDIIESSMWFISEEIKKRSEKF